MQVPPGRVLGFLLFCLLLTAGAWLGARWAEQLPQKIAAATEAALEQKALELRSRFFALAQFQPRLRVRNRVLSETSAGIAELAVLVKDLELEREFAHTWAGSTKTLRLRGKYRIKAGFNLLSRFEISVEKGRTKILLPPASLLSVEQQELHVEALENGYWNPISADDLETSIAALQDQARQQAAPMVSQAEQQFQRQLHDHWDSTADIVRTPL